MNKKELIEILDGIPDETNIRIGFKKSGVDDIYLVSLYKDELLLTNSNRYCVIDDFYYDLDSKELEDDFSIIYDEDSLTKTYDNYEDTFNTHENCLHKIKKEY